MSGQQATSKVTGAVVGGLLGGIVTNDPWGIIGGAVFGWLVAG